MTFEWYLVLIAIFIACYLIFMDYIIDIKVVLKDIWRNTNDDKDYKQWIQPDHINCRCAVSMAEKDLVEKLEKKLLENSHDYIDFFRHYFPKAYQVYENKAGNICIQFKKDAFEYDSRVESLFLEEFGRHIKLLSISSFDSSHILVTLHILSEDITKDNVFVDGNMIFTKRR